MRVNCFVSKFDDIFFDRYCMRLGYMCYNVWVNVSSGGKVLWWVGYGVFGWYSDVFSDRCELGYFLIRSNIF